MEGFPAKIRQYLVLAIFLARSAVAVSGANFKDKEGVLMNEWQESYYLYRLIC